MKNIAWKITPKNLTCNSICDTSKDSQPTGESRLSNPAFDNLDSHPLRSSLEAEGEDRIVKVMDWKTAIEPRIKSSVPIAKVRTARFSTNN